LSARIEKFAIGRYNFKLTCYYEQKNRINKTVDGLRMLTIACCAVFFSSLSFTASAGWKEPSAGASLNAPPVSISGKVTDSKNAPLEGVSIVIKGTGKGTVTGAAGTFTLNNVPETECWFLVLQDLLQEKFP